MIVKMKHILVKRKRFQVNNLYNIVKDAIDNKISLQLLSAQYYLNEDIACNARLLYKKAVAITNISGTKIIHKIENYDDYLKIIKNGTISIYEPVVEKTKSFRLGIISELSKSQLLNSLTIIRDRLIEAGFVVDIIKYDGHYGIKCLSKKEYNTEKLYSFAAELTNGFDIDLSELKIGKLKRFYYSLDDNGNKDIIINIGING